MVRFAMEEMSNFWGVVSSTFWRVVGCISVVLECGTPGCVSRKIGEGGSVGGAPNTGAGGGGAGSGAWT